MSRVTKELKDLYDTPIKVKKRRKRRKRFTRKDVGIKGLKLTEEHKNGKSLKTQERNKIVNAVSNSESISEIQHKSPIIWTVRNVHTEKGEPMDFGSRPYLVDIYKDFSPHVVVKKGAQIGLTQLSICKCLYVSDVKSLTTIYTFPTQTDVSNFSKARFKSIMSGSAYLRARIKNYDSHGYREIGNSRIYFRGSFAARQAISVPSDLNIHDELDFSDPEVRSLYSARLSVSNYKWEWDFSTPTLPNYGIDALWRDSDKHIWVVKCPRCGKSQSIDFFKNLMRRDKLGGEERWYFGCRKCKRPLDRKKGQWVSMYPDRETRGYFVPQTICPVISAKYMVDEYRKSKKKGDMKKFYNFNLGRTFESGITTLTRGVLTDKIVPGTAQSGNIIIGADQGDVLHVVVKKLTDKARIIWLGILHSIEELDQLIAHYSRYNRVLAVLDALPNHAEAMRYSASRHNLYLCYYTLNGKIEPEDIKEEAQQSKELHIARTEALDHTAHLWRSGEMLIENYVNINDIEEFITQMTNMKRDIQEDNQGIEKPVWVKTGQDHYRHADVYSWVAQQLFANQMSNELIVSSDEFAIAEKEDIFQETDLW